MDRRRVAGLLPLVAVCAPTLVACKFINGNGTKAAVRPPPPGPTLVYKCFPGITDSGTPAELGGGANGFDLHLAWLPKPAGSAAESQLVLASDDRYELAPSAVVFVFDFARARVDQVRDRDGKALELDVNARSVSWEEAEVLRHVKFGKLILENAQQALKNNAASDSRADFTVEGTKYTASSPRVILPATLSFGPMATVISVSTSASNSKNLCQYTGAK